MKKMNKTRALLEHLQTRGSITSMEAIDRYGATRLSAIIFNLRKRGYDIDAVECVCKDRFGNTCRYAKYVLDKE